MTTTDLAATAEERGIRYFMIAFTDLLGVQRAKLVFRRPAVASSTASGHEFLTKMKKKEKLNFI